MNTDKTAWAAKQLRTLRKNRKLSVVQVSAATGVARSSIWRAESGENTLLATVFKLLEFYEAPLSSLDTGDPLKHQWTPVVEHMPRRETFKCGRCGVIKVVDEGRDPFYRRNEHVEDHYPAPWAPQLPCVEQ